MAQTVIDFSDFYHIISPSFWDAFENKSRIRVIYGGAGSGKSFFVFQEMIYNMVVHGCNYMVVRQTANSNRTSTYSLTKKIISDLNLWTIFKENKSDMTFQCISNNAKVVFRGMEDVERLKSIAFEGGSGILERIIFEESSEGNFLDFSQLNVRLRGTSKNFFQFTLLLNPVSSTNWVKTTFFDRDDFHAFIHKTTYKNNPFIDADYVKVLEEFKRVDENFYNIYCLGMWGESRGRIFSNYEAREFPFNRSSIDSSEILAGCDWGYNHPTCLTLSIIRDGVLYTFDELTAFENTNQQFMQMVKETEFIEKNQKVVYDSEDPARGQEFHNGGYQFVPAKKVKGSIIRTIDYLKSFDKWVIDPKRCPRLLQELEQYHWRVDKDNKPMDEPAKFMDDAIASVRYAIEHLAYMRGKPGVLSGTVDDIKKEAIQIRRDMRHKAREVSKAMARKKREDRKNNII